MIVWLIFEIGFLLLEAGLIHRLTRLQPIYKHIKDKCAATVEEKHYTALAKVKEDIALTVILLFFSTFCLIDCFINNIVVGI